MERLGFWSIVKLTTRILLTNLQHFLCITLLIALMNVLTFIAVGPFNVKVLQHSISVLYKISSSQAGALYIYPDNFNPYENSFIANPPPRFIRCLAYIVSLSISLVCTILVTFSVSRACLNKSVDLKGSLRGVPRSAKNLLLTMLVEIGLVLMFVLLASLGMVIIAGGLSAVEANVEIPIIIMAIGVAGGVVYIGILLSLTNTVAILEEKKGWEAISKSAYLIKGSRWIVVGLNCLYGVMTMVALSLTALEQASVVYWRWVAGGVSVGLPAFTMLFAMVSTVVLYMACKSGKGVPLETALLAASPQFGPPSDSAPKYLDLETAAFSTTTQ